jgi:hypothetical protein
MWHVSQDAGGKEGRKEEGRERRRRENAQPLVTYFLQINDPHDPIPFQGPTSNHCCPGDPAFNTRASGRHFRSKPYQMPRCLLLEMKGLFLLPEMKRL